MGRVLIGSGQTRTLLFFLDPDPDLDPKGPKFSDPDPDPKGLTGSRVLNGSLMGLIQSLFDLSKLKLFRVFFNFYKQLIIVLQILVRVQEIQIQNRFHIKIITINLNLFSNQIK